MPAEGARQPASGVATAEEPGVVERPTAAPARLGFVDSLRALAALYVVLDHIGQEIWPYQNVPAGVISLLTHALAYGRLAVSVFIVLSGFSLMLPVVRNGNRLPWGAWGFYWRRARRILPTYYLAMALSLLLIWLLIGHRTGALWDIVLPVTLNGIVEHLLLVQDFARVNDVTINYVFWSIAMECQIYVVFPALILLWRRYPPLASMLLIVTLSLLLFFALTLTWVGRLPSYAWTEFAPQFFGLFAMGMFAASLTVRPTPRWTRLRAVGLWDVLALACLVVVIVMSGRWPLFALDLCIGVGTVGVLLAASRPGRFNLLRPALEWRPLVWIGGFSYSVYLIHAPLIQVLWQYALHPLGLGATPTYLALLLVGLPLIVAASWVFWYFCERPFLSSRPTARRAQSAAQTRVRAAANSG